MIKSKYSSVIKKIDKIHKKRRRLNKLEDKLSKDLSFFS
jgi:hypothetical protein